MKKAERITSFVKRLASSAEVVNFSDYDPCYLGYFECFNTQHYYEAHDVLEHLWLKAGQEAPDYTFHKGLIQLAGGFVHLKLQHSYPGHSKHGKRLHPAQRLFLRAIENMTPYGESHYGLDLIAPITLAQSYAALLERGDYCFNPWSPDHAPLLPLPRERE